MNFKSLLISTALASVALASVEAFANTNAGGSLYVCATPQNSDLDQTEYEALTWVEVGSLGSHGETGNNQNILTYDTWNTGTIQKAKGINDAGSPEIEVARLATDPGQVILRAAAVATNNNNYAFKTVMNDAVGSGEPTVKYNRGIVTGPRHPHGRNEDFDIEIYQLGLNQEQLVVQAGAGGTAPAFTAAPAITGTETVGETLTVSNGTVTGDATITYTYRWYANGVPISGANSNTYDLTAAEEGKVISARVVATNDSGHAVGFSDTTGAIAAA